MLYTEQNVRDNIRNRDGNRVFFLDSKDTLTPGARDFLQRERIQILPASAAPIGEYRLLDGGILREKPEQMTHLHGNVLVPKTHPRIAFRGAMDTLEAELLLCQQATNIGELGEILRLARHLIRCEVMDEPVKWERLCGLTEQELRSRSHRPQDFYGQPHFMPGPEDGELLLQVNRARCAARSAELKAVAAFPTGREDLLRAFNRLSSFLYLIMIQLKKEM